tara:strand:+ start:481 stop:789 length:309 start_codon:yes stop_codon:yes gene_type:complete
MAVNIKVRDTQKLFSNLHLEKDLKNISSFKKWLRGNLIIYKDIDDTDVPNGDALIFLNHIEFMLINNEIDGDINRSVWVKKVGKIIADLKTDIRSKEKRDAE